MTHEDAGTPSGGPDAPEAARWTVSGGNGQWTATSPRGASLSGFPSEECATSFAGHMDGVQRVLDAANIDWSGLFRPPPQDLDKPGPGPLRVVR